MEDIKEKKQEIRADILKKLKAFSRKEKLQKAKALEERLFEFANFMEANTTLLYLNRNGEFDMRSIVKRCLDQHKIIALPAFDVEKYEMVLMKVSDLDADLVTGPRGMLEPDPEKCKVIPIDCIDLAVVPGLAFDEKGGRLGSGEGYYDRFIPQLPVTARKVTLAFERQVIQQIPMESHDRHVDIIISEQRIIYKI